MSTPQQIIGRLISNFFKIKRQNMFEVSIPNQEVLAKTRTEINMKLAKYYKDPLMKNYLNSLPPKCLLDQSVVMFVGSRARPQNLPLRNELIQIAIQKASQQEIKLISIMTKEQKEKFLFSKENHHISDFKNLNQQNRSQNKSLKGDEEFQAEDTNQFFIPNSEKHLAKYYTHAFTKYEAMEKNEPERWEACAETIIDLADKGHPLSSMTLAKDYYFRIDSENLSREKKSQLVIEAAQYFYQSVTETNLNGLYYIGEMLSQYPELHESTPQQIEELYIYAAANGNPLAFFQLAQIAKNKGNMKIYMKYLKAAAEGGCVEAQFNLGEEYRNGLNVKKDFVKAFAWFKHSGAHGFVYGKVIRNLSKFNEALMLYQGSECGRIKRNLKAALLQFEDIQRSNTIDVSVQIERILQQEQIQKEMEESIKEEKIVESPEKQKQKSNSSVGLKDNKEK